MCCASLPPHEIPSQEGSPVVATGVRTFREGMDGEGTKRSTRVTNFVNPRRYINWLGQITTLFFSFQTGDINPHEG